ncbi:serine/threonine protein kinase [Micromonospora musae]|uniref:serine/threonine protein kinase n=1 Tax=Micromonospora musae TaxID=1894970 RepID=UPI001F3C62D7
MLTRGVVLSERYRLSERVATGGMGAVWRCTDLLLEREVAVKVLLPTLVADAEFTTRFRAEARMLAALRHPGVVAVHDVGQAVLGDDSLVDYLVMEYVEGEPLTHWIGRAGRLDAGSTMSVVAQAAEALHAAHVAGIVHRDVKPGNLLVKSDGRVVLVDFGIARSRALSGLTAANIVLGTASFMSPEQATGQPVSAASDVYALGAVTYLCLAGQPPFVGENPLEVALRHQQDEPAPLPPGTPPAVVELVARAMAKRPADRYGSAAELARAAAEARRGILAGSAHPVPPPWAAAGGPAQPPAPPVAPGGVHPPATPVPPPPPVPEDLTYFGPGPAHPADGAVPAAPAGSAGPAVPGAPDSTTPSNGYPAPHPSPPATPAGGQPAVAVPPAPAFPTSPGLPPAGGPTPPAGGPNPPAHGPAGGPNPPAHGPAGGPNPPAHGPAGFPTPPAHGPAGFPTPPAGGPAGFPGGFAGATPIGQPGPSEWPNSLPPIPGPEADTLENPVGSGSSRRRVGLIGAAAAALVALVATIGVITLRTGGEADDGDRPPALAAESAAAQEQGQEPVPDSAGATPDSRPTATPRGTGSASPTASAGGSAVRTAAPGGEESTEPAGGDGDAPSPTSKPTSSKPEKPNPYTANQACGPGYQVIDSATLTGGDGRRRGRVYLLYNTGNGNNCVVTLKDTAVGTKTTVSAYLEVKGQDRTTESGSFDYYAGPVTATAPGKCVKWGGSTGGASYASPFEHCD